MEGAEGIGKGSSSDNKRGEGRGVTVAQLGLRICIAKQTHKINVTAAGPMYTRPVAEYNTLFSLFS